MFMHKIIFIFVINSLLLSNQDYIRCGLIDEVKNPNRDRNRPTTDTHAESPSGHFWIHYDEDGDHAPLGTDTNPSNGVPDYVDEVGKIADEVREIFINQMGYNQEEDDSDGIYDIFLQDRAQGQYGVNTPDQNGGSWIVIDNEYEAGEFWTSGIETMKIVVVHEFFHAVQRTYANPTDSNLFFFEMSSTWIEDIIVPDVNDYIHFVDSFFDNPTKKIDDTDGYSIALYGHYLTQVIEEEPSLDSIIIRQIWTYMYDNNVSAYVAIDAILNNNYAIDFSDTWVDFCARNFFNNFYSNMDNDFYYYEDQIIAEPIIFNENIQSLDLGSIVSFDLSLNTKRISIESFTPNNDMIININNLDSDIIGQYVKDSPNTSSHHISKIINSDPIYLGSSDKIYLLFGTDRTDNFQDISLIVNDCCSSGDVNQNFIINIADIVEIVKHDFILPNSESELLADVNFDGSINVNDLVGIVSIIKDLDAR